MLDFLKKKLSKVVDSFSKKVEEKEDAPMVEPTQTSIEVKQEPLEAESKIEEAPVDAPVEEIAESLPEIEKDTERIEEKAVEEIKAEDVAEELKSQEPPIEVQEKKPKKSWIKKIVDKVSRKVVEKVLSEEDIKPIMEELQTDLIESDVALSVAEKITEDLKKNLVGRPIRRGKDKEEIKNSLRQSLLEILLLPKIDLDSLSKEKKPVTVVFLGFNGAGKTTSLAKTASWLLKNNHTCVFAAADTFRAAAEEQLEVHANNLKVNLIKHQYGADPAAVIFDAIAHAKSKNIDFVLADTAGRAHTNANLMDQLQKIIRVNKPDLKILVIDSLAGNDALLQARMFNEAGVDAVIFTKVDVNEKGGAILSVAHELKKPILFLGMGQDYHNFEAFDAEKFVNSLLE